MSVAHTSGSEPAKRASHEGALLALLRNVVSDLDVECITGQGGANRFGIEGWGLSGLQQFQFGDLRIELPTSTVLVEAESAGGVGNLIKYWPLLRSRSLTKRLVLIHVYMLGSEGDFIAHRKLWSFVVDRMTVDLQAVDVRRPDQWDPHLFTYLKGVPPDDVMALLRITVAEGSLSSRLSPGANS